MSRRIAPNEHWVVVCDEHVSTARRSKDAALADMHTIVAYGACKLPHKVIQVDQWGRPLDA